MSIEPIEKAPCPDREQLDAIEAGLTEGDVQRVEQDALGQWYEVMDDGRRIPIPEWGPCLITV